MFIKEAMPYFGASVSTKEGRSLPIYYVDVK